MSTKPLPLKLASEIGTLRTEYSSEITVDRPKENDYIFIEYLTIFKSHNIKIIFKFDFNNIASTIDISLANARKKGGKLPGMAADFLTSMLMDKFTEQIDNQPVYACIEFFDREFALKNASSSPLKTAKQTRVIKKIAKAQKQKTKAYIQNTHIPKPKPEKEYVAFLRFSRLLGSQQKKETQILAELNSLKDSSTTFYAYVFYGTPGIICIRASSKVIKHFSKRCNEIGKKACISHIIDKIVMKRYISKNQVQTVRNDSYNRGLISFLDNFKLEDRLKTLDIILSEKVKKNRKNKKSKSSKEMYSKDCKYEFNVEIGFAHHWNAHSANKGSLQLSLFGHSNAQLIGKHKFSFKRWYNASVKFEFSSVDFLNKIGCLSKICIENYSKEQWECTWVKINVYQISNGKKKNRSAPILKQEYQALKINKYIRCNSSLTVNLNKN